MKRILFSLLLLFAFAAQAQNQAGAFLMPNPAYYWAKQKQVTVVNQDTWQYVVVAKEAEMQADYDDIRFLLNPVGSSSQKVFLEHYIESFDGSQANVWVAVPSGTTAFYLLYGNNYVSGTSSGYRSASAAGYFFNDFSRGVDFDVVNVLGGYDVLLAGDANGEETWPAGWQDPDDKLHCGVIYKRQATNIHAGNPTTYTAQKITTDGWQTFGSETIIDNPGSTYHTSSSTSNSIPSSDPTELTFTVGAGLPWVTGDLGQARADDLNYFDFSVVSYSGTTLVVNSSAHIGSGTFTSWTISDRVGATNATITAVKMYNGTVRLVMLNSHVNYSISAGTIRVGTKYSDDWGATWSTWTQRGPNQWINVGGQAITMANKYVVLSAHQNQGFDGMTEHTLWFFVSRDFGETWSTHSVQLAGVYLDETGMFQKKSTTTWDWVADKVKVICRVESTPFHYYTFDLTIDASSIANTTPVENAFYVDEQSRGTYTWVGNRIWGAFGDVREQMVYSDDGGDTWHPVAYTTFEGSIYSSRRVYTIMYNVGDQGELVKILSNNKLSGGADLYINYWDAYLMALRPIANATLTDTRPRPIDLDPGLRINGSLIPGYRTTSSTSNSIPTGAGQQRTFTVETGLSWQAGDEGTANNSTSARFRFTTISYSTNQLVVEWLANTGTGTFSSWTIDKLTNLLNDQAFVSDWNKNGKTTGFKLKMNTKSPAVAGGYFGSKKDETRATAVVTISNAGAAGDVITLKWSTSSPYGGLFTGLGKVATYTVQSGDNIAAVVNGLVASANALNICPVSSSNSTTLTVFAPRGESTFINGLPLTVTTTGTVAGSSGNFSGGATQEGVVALQNIAHFDVSNNLARIEQANDGFNPAFTLTKDVFVNPQITWTSSSVVATDGTTTVTKTPSDGSGIPDWWGEIILYVSTSEASPQGFHENMKIMAIPSVDTSCTIGSAAAGNYRMNLLNNGIQ